MNDFVFRRGADGLEFVGDFDGLYASEEDPWQQSGRQDRMKWYYAHSRTTMVSGLCRHQAQGPGLEIGCGLGHLTFSLQKLFGPVDGMDISAEAIARARDNYPGLTFTAGDIMKAKPAGEYAFVIWAQVLWYVLHGLDEAITNTLACLKPGGLFVVTQAFLPEQRYGREVVDGFCGTVSRLMQVDGLRLIHAEHDDRSELEYHDGLLIFRKG